ncbi:response regulator receiver [Oscillochloris trichoides DG-6]|uniref:Response regulator receiver n=1 Tax=Oscillochloris trichoides DG-6 TaxID=765420 RepID=E1IIL3_9CHLR|nr:response regulator [Oscillochloris trichoides]EFO78963.1 response regulator receiver [Oscillochloris trichoides DG-6]
MPEHLMLIEDDLVLQVSLSAMLRREGYTLLVARSVAEAHTLLEREHPIVVLLDLGLPDGSGFDVLNEINQSPDRPLVIVTTANDSMGTAIKALRLGAFDFLTKPINNNLLRNAIRRAVEHYRLRQSAREIELLRAHEEAMRATARAAAHHISQHLTVIMGETQLLQEELHDPEVRSSLERILRATEQAAQTLADLRSARHFVIKEVQAVEPILDLDAAAGQRLEPI